jgi:hypothetical protein
VGSGGKAVKGRTMQLSGSQIEFTDISQL